MKFIEKLQEGMRSDSPGCIFGLLQLIFGKGEIYEGESIYRGNDDGPGSHIEN